MEEQMCFQMKIGVWAAAIREHLVYVWGLKVGVDPWLPKRQAHQKRR